MSNQYTELKNQIQEIDILWNTNELDIKHLDIKISSTLQTLESIRDTSISNTVIYHVNQQIHRLTDMLEQLYEVNPW
jgi:hypothetical protein